MNSSLNHIYSVVWNASLGLWQVASEVVRRGGKTQSEQRKNRKLRAVAGLMLVGMSAPGAVWAQLPTGGQVVGGQASIVQNGNSLNITQGTDRAAIDWQSFNVGQGNTVNFVQPSVSSVALNRVLGADVSLIQGAINANGQVFLVNQNGVLFTPTSQVNVGGIVASTQSISTADFMAGKYTFSGNSTGTVNNQGNIVTSAGGTVALIAAKIVNTGTITAPQGTIGLAAGNTVTLDLGGPVKVQVSEGALNTLIEQGGGLVADGGRIYLTAKAAGDLAASAINHTGISRARTMAQGQAGEVVMVADMQRGITTVAGTLDASAPLGGNGGFIETSAAKVKIQNGVNITTQAAQGQNGQFLIDPFDFTIAESGGDITGSALSTALRNGNVTIQTQAAAVNCTGAICGTGFADGNGDIFVNDSINDASNFSNTLVFQALRDININKSVNVKGLVLSAIRNVNVSDAVTVDRSLEVNFGANADFTANTAVRPSESSALNMRMNQDGFVGKINLGTNVSNSPLLPGVKINGLAYTVVRDRSGLQDVANNLTGRFVLASDIDLGGTAWAPIGNGTPNNQRFSGVVEGFGHKVDRLSITTRPSSRNGGLFGLVRGGVISNLGVAGTVNFSSGESVGGLVGNASDATIRNVFSNVDVSSSSTGAAISVGGLIGSVAGSTTVLTAFSTGTVTGQSSASQPINVGGLVGSAGSGAQSISRVFAVGDVNVSGAGETNGGGLIGSVTESLSLSHAFATGKVTATGGSSRLLGGLVGGISNNSSTGVNISNTYATGLISSTGTGTAFTGGLVGFTSKSGSKTIADSYWDATKTGQANAVSADSTTTAVISRVASASIGAAGAQFPNLNEAEWIVINGTPMLKIFSPLIIQTPVFIRLDCGSCESIYGETPQFSFKAFNAASGGTAVADANLSGTALYSLTLGGVAAGNELGRLSDVGAYSVTYTSGLSGNAIYRLAAGVATTFTIKPKLLTVAIQAAVGSPLSRVYNGNDNFTLTADNFAISGFVDQQGTGASINQTAATFNSKNVLDANTLTANLASSNLVVAQGVKASNYSLPASATGEGSITAKSLSVIGLTAQNKDYDGTRTAVVTGTAAVDTTGVIQGDMVSVSGAVTSGLFADKDAGNNKVVAATTTGLSLAGDQAGNYALSSVDLKADIAPKALTINGTAVADKDYDGNRTASVTVGTLSGLVTVDGVTETLGATLAEGSFEGKDVVRDAQGNVIAQNVAVTYTLSNGAAQNEVPGAKAANYTLAAETRTAKINPRTLTIAGTTVADKTYDGNQTAVVTLGALSGVLQGETLGETTASGTFASKDVARDAQGNVIAQNVNVVYTLADGTTTTLTTINTLPSFGCLLPGAPCITPVTVISAPVTVQGAKAGNYTLAAETKTATISAKALTVTGTTVDNKTYDGKRTATVNVGELSGLVKGESLGTTTATGMFANQDAGEGKNVSVVYTLSNGADALHKAGNYSLAEETRQATIEKRALSVAGTVVADKDYDGNRTAQVTVGTVSGLVEGEVLGVTTAMGTFDGKDVVRDTQGNVIAQNVAVAYTLNNGAAQEDSLSELASAKASNYTLAAETKTAKINPKALTIQGTTVASKTYDGTASAVVTVGTLSGLVEGETLGTTTSTGTFADKDAGEAKNVTVAYTLSNANNYSLANETKQADIAQKQLTVTDFAAANKIYDGNTTATISNAGKLVGVIDSDTAKVALTNNGATFDTKNVGMDKTVTLNGINLTGDEAKNYVLSNEAVTAKAEISKKEISLTGFDAANKVYDGGTAAQIANSGSLSGVVLGDTVTVGNTGATFDNRNAGTGKTVTLNGVSLAGTDAANYDIASTVTDSADISRKDIVLTGFDAANKVYDRNTVARIINAGSLNGVVEGDSVSVTNTGATFDNRNAGTGKTVTLNGVSLAGADAGNYNVAGTVTDIADIGRLGGVVVTAQNKEKQAGTADPVLTLESTGLLEGDSLAGNLVRDAGEAPGTYQIRLGSVGNSNYEISGFNAAQLLINQNVPSEVIATVDTLSASQLRPSLVDLPPVTQTTPLLVDAGAINLPDRVQVVVVDGGINLGGIEPTFFGLIGNQSTPAENSSKEEQQ